MRLEKNGVYATGSYVCESLGGINRRTEMKAGSLMFSKKDQSNPIFMERSGDALVIRAGGTFDDATDATVLMRILKNAIYIDADTVGPGGLPGKTGKAEFSDGTYLEFSHGFLMGGSTKEGSF